MALGPLRRRTERGIRDHNGTPVLMLYDETNDKTIMARADEKGNLHVISSAIDTDGSVVEVSVTTQNGLVMPFVNTDSQDDKIENIIEQLKILNMHMAMMTDTWVDNEDIDKE